MEAASPLFSSTRISISSSSRTFFAVSSEKSNPAPSLHTATVPAALRKELGQTFHITVGQDRCLSVYSDESWAAFMDKLKALSYNEVKKLRALFAYAADCEPDGQGRILIPAKLREYAGLTREVVVIGSFDRAEIWDAERWAAVENDAFASGELESAMAEMGL